MVRLFFLVRWLVVVGVCAGVCVGQDARYLGQQSWSTEEGLPQSSVHSIAQTKDGYIWAATEGGLARFDGVGFAVFGRGNEAAFKSDDLCCLVARADGLWVGSSDGLVRMEGGKFRRYGVADGLASDFVLSLMEGAQGLVVESTGGWSRWDGARFVAAERGDAGWRVLGGELSAKGVAGTWRVGRGSGGCGGRTGNSKDECGGLSTALRSGRDDGLYREGVSYPGRELPAGRVTAVEVDREGLVWVGMNKGLVVADPVSRLVTNVEALKGSGVLSVMEDAEGNHWVGTETTGLHVLRRLKFRSEVGLAGVPVTAVAQATDQAIWVGSREDGLRRLRGGVWDQPVAAKEITSSVVLCLEPAAARDGRRGGMWVGTPDGLNLLEPEGARVRVRRITSADGLPDESIRSLAVAVDGDGVWAGTRRGLVHVRVEDGRVSVAAVGEAGGLRDERIGAMTMSTQGALWVATAQGLSRVGREGMIAKYGAKEGLGGGIVKAITEDEAGRIWAASEDGTLSRLEGQRFVAVAKLGGRENKIVDVEPDYPGHLWVRMERGVQRVSQTGVEEAASYGVADGMPNSEVVPEGSNAMWLAAGEMWVPTRGGVAVADPLHFPVNRVAPPVAIERLLIDDVPQVMTGDVIELKAGRSRLTVEYAGLSFVAPSEVRYRYLLEGFDEQWIDAGARRSATYTNLPPGTYTFRVRARNNDGVWSAADATLTLRVVPPFYRRWWFVVLCVLLLGAALVGLYLLRLRRLRQQFDAVLAERSRMAREIHDTLTQDFVGTSLQLDILAQHLKSGKIGTAIEDVRRTRLLVTEGLEEARRSIWELRVNGAQDSLPTRLRNLVARDRFAAMAPKVKVGGAYRVLEARVEREVLRVAQEALANALQHAEAAACWVELEYGSDALLLTVRDEGRGFSMDEAARKEGHFGLVGMRERAASIGGTLEVASAVGRGTSVRLRVPLEGPA